MRSADGLSWGDRVAIAVAVAVQAVVLAGVSPLLQPAWVALLALAVGVAALPELRVRPLWLALAARLALTAGTIGFAGWWLALAAPGTEPATRIAHRPWSSATLLMLAGWWFALAAPVTVVRWWVRVRDARDAPREVAEALGLSLVATALGLSARRPESAWALLRGTAWATGLCLALGVVAVGWAWACWARRRAWTREPEGGALHAPGEGGEAPYRATRWRAPVARVARGWWVRRALHVAALAWGFALVDRGPWRPERYWPKPPEGLAVGATRPQPDAGALAAAMQAIRVGDDPCRVGPGPEAHRDFDLEVDWYGHPRRRRGTVWSSGGFYSQNVVSQGELGMQPEGGCALPEDARRWIERDDLDALWRVVDRSAALERDRQEESAHPCARGQWCSMAWQGAAEALPGHMGGGRYWIECALRPSGRFAREAQSGRIPAEAARTLFGAVEAFARDNGAFMKLAPPLEISRYGPWAPPALMVEIGGAGLFRLESPWSRSIGEALWYRLCERLPPNAGPPPEGAFTLSEGT